MVFKTEIYVKNSIYQSGRKYKNVFAPAEPDAYDAEENSDVFEELVGFHGCNVLVKGEM